MKEIVITDEFIELYKLMKFENMAASGGEAKHMIAEGLVRVNGEVETRKRKKIFSGDIVACGPEQVRVRVNDADATD